MYKKMMQDAQAQGLTSEKMMWDSVDDVEDMLCALYKEHPDKYWHFIRKTHGLLFKGHYTEEFAIHDVKHLKYTNKKGEKKEGPYWTVEQIEEATKGLNFPSGVNKWDKYVAYNVVYSDNCKGFDDAQILDMAYLQFFHDEDFPHSTKIWDYMCMIWKRK